MKANDKIILNDTSLERLGNAIKAARFTRADFAAAAGYTPQWLNQILHGRNKTGLRFSDLTRFADLLGVSVDYLADKSPWRTKAEARAAELLRAADEGAVESSTLYKLLQLRGYTFLGVNKAKNIDMTTAAHNLTGLLDLLPDGRLELGECNEYLFKTPEGREVVISVEGFAKAEALAADIVASIFLDKCEDYEGEDYE